LNEQWRNRYHGYGNYKLIRYADDFVIISNDRLVNVLVVKQEVKEFLDKQLHLELSAEKTKLTHLKDGCNFLGFSIRMVRPNNKWVTHIRPSQQAKERIKTKIKELTSRQNVMIDEYTMITALNAAVRGWAEYYKYTSLLKDISDISWYTSMRYFQWLCKKHKGKRASQLIRAKTKVIYNTIRWITEIRKGGKPLRTFQWHPTRMELKRTRYLLRRKDEFYHPYLPVKS
jgi:RNA-directed DNA polymerase